MTTKVNSARFLPAANTLLSKIMMKVYRDKTLILCKYGIIFIVGKSLNVLYNALCEFVEQS